MFSNLKKIVFSLHRIEDNQKEIISLLKEQKPQQTTDEKQNEWMQQGIDNILGYEWPPKRGE